MRAAARMAVPTHVRKTDESGPSCSACRFSYTNAAWNGLPRVTTLAPEDLERHVLTWPKNRVVHVRSCARCGHSMARVGDADARELL